MMGDVNLSVFDIENLPNHKVKNSNEWSSSCPQCPPYDGTSNKNRFIFTVDKGAYWCRQCGFGGYVGQSTCSLTDDQQADIEYRQRQARLEELQSQQTILEHLQARRPDLIYHRNLNGKTGYVKRRWGLTDATIEWFMVGYCHACPTSSHSDSITIPYYEDQALVNIRHRLSSPNGNGKYRPEVTGLPSSIFNIDSLKQYDGWVILVEGEFKTMVLWQFGFPTVGIPGTTFKAEWVESFSDVERVYIALDPGAEKAALKAGKLLCDAGTDIRIVSVPTKPDDYFVVDGGTALGFSRLLEAGRTYDSALRGDTSRWTRRYEGAFGKLRS
jgi:hypothetical protein